MYIYIYIYIIPFWSLPTTTLTSRFLIFSSVWTGSVWWVRVRVGDTFSSDVSSLKISSSVHKDPTLSLDCKRVGCTFNSDILRNSYTLVLFHSPLCSSSVQAHNSEPSVSRVQMWPEALCLKDILSTVLEQLQRGCMWLISLTQTHTHYDLRCSKSINHMRHCWWRNISGTPGGKLLTAQKVWRLLETFLDKIKSVTWYHCVGVFHVTSLERTRHVFFITS